MDLEKLSAGRIGILLLFLLLLLLCPGSAIGQDVFSINVTSDKLVRINPATGEVTEIGLLGRDAGYVDLAMMNGRLYALNSETSNELWEIDTATGKIRSSVTVTGYDIKKGEALTCLNGKLRIAFVKKGQSYNYSKWFGILSTSGGISYLAGPLMYNGNPGDIDGLGVDENGQLYTAHISDTGDYPTNICKFYPSEIPKNQFDKVGTIRESATCGAGGKGHGNADVIVSGSRIYALGPCSKKIFTIVDGITSGMDIRNNGIPVSGSDRERFSGIELAPETATPPVEDPNDCPIIPSITSARSGDWGRISTWQGGRVPSKSDKILVSPEHVISNLPKTLKINALCNRGTIESGIYSALNISAPGGIYNYGEIKSLNGDDFAVKKGSPLARANSGKDIILKAKDGIILNYGQIISGSGSDGTENHPGGHGGKVELWAARIENSESAVIEAGNGGSAEKRGGGRGGSIQLLKYKKTKCTVLVMGILKAGDGGESSDATGGKGGDLFIDASEMHVADADMETGYGGSGKNEKRDGKDGRLKIDPDVTDIGSNVSVKGGDIKIAGGDNHLLDMSSTQNTLIRSSGDITLAVGDDGEIDLSGNQEKILKAAGNINIFSDSVKMDPEQTLNDVIEADGAINRDKAKKLQDTLLSADTEIIGETGSVIPLSVLLTNIGAANDVYKVLFNGSSGWTREEQYSLEQGETSEITVDVTVPDTAGASEIITISASSQNDSASSFSQDIEIIAVDDLQETGSDTDGDGILDIYDEDDDDDGMPDIWEIENMLDPVSNDGDEDLDGDGDSNRTEYINETDPTDEEHNSETVDSDGDGHRNGEDAFINDPEEWEDTDNDGTGNNKDQDDDNDLMADQWETAHDTNLLSNDAYEDMDGDGYTNMEEYQSFTDPSDYRDNPQGADIYASPLAAIDFETIPGSLPEDGMELDDQFRSSHGIRFVLDSDRDGFPDDGDYPTLEKAWDPNSNKPEKDGKHGFLNNENIHDKAHPNYRSELGSFFLKMDGLKNNLIILYDKPVSAASGQIWDIDGSGAGTEQWKIEAMGENYSSGVDQVIATIESPVGKSPYKSLDAKPWTWSFNRVSKDIYAIRISFTGTKQRGLGLAFDQFAPDSSKITAGTFMVYDSSGEVRVDYLFDGGLYEGELGICSLAGMENLEPGSEEFVAETVRRVMSDSEEGHIVIRDRSEGARFDGPLGDHEIEDYNKGNYLGLKKVKMRQWDTFILVLVPDGTFEEIAENPGTDDPKKRPLFSLATANPDDGLYYGQIAGIPVENMDNSLINAVVFEDMSADNSDRDYNDLIVQFRGVTVCSPTIDSLIAADADWRMSDTGIIEHLNVPAPDSDPENCWMTVTLKSPADILLYAPDGTFIGKDGGTIAGATFEWDENGHQVITLSALDEGEYRVVLRAIDEGGLCHLEVKVYKGGGELAVKEIPVTIEPHQVLKTTLPVSAFVESQTVRFETPEIPKAADGTALPFDFDGDGDIDDADIERVSGKWGICEGDSEYDAFYDLDENGCIDFVDIMSVANSWHVDK